MTNRRDTIVMDADLQDLLAEHRTAFQVIKRIVPNYKKLSKALITLGRTRTRLSELQKQWEKVQVLHVRIDRLATARDRKQLPYFLQEEFFAAKEAYLEAWDSLHAVSSGYTAPANPGDDPAPGFTANGSKQQQRQPDGQKPANDKIQENRVIKDVQQPPTRAQDANKDQVDQKPAPPRTSSGDRDVKCSGESGEERNNRRNREDGERTLREQGEFTRGSPTEGRETREFRNSNETQRSEYGERRGHGGSYKTGVKPVDKKDGAGSHNWGIHNDEIEGSLNQDNQDWTNDKPDADPHATTEDKEGENGGTVNAAVEEKPAEEETRELTLDEGKVLRNNRVKPQYNLRKAGEGEDLSRWKKRYALEKKKEGPEEEEEEEVSLKLDLAEEDEQCERHFVSTHSRTAEGGFGEIADAQVTRTDVSRASDVLRATACANPHTEGSCVKVRTLVEQGSTLSLSSKSLGRSLRPTRPCADPELPRLGEDCIGHTK